MIKTSLKTPFIQIDYQEFNEILADFIMSEDKLPFRDTDPDDLDVVLGDLPDINQILPNEYIQSDEERRQIYQLEQELKSPSASSNESFNQFIYQHSHLLNPIDRNLIRPESGTQLPINSSIETTQSVPIGSPLSPDTQISIKMDTLSIGVGNTSSQITSLCNTNQIMDPSFQSHSILSSQTERRGRCETYNGPYNIYDVSQTATTFFEPFIEVQTPIDINTPSNRVRHAVQPYSRSFTDPLPPFAPTFVIHRPEVSMNSGNPTLSSFTSGTNIMVDFNASPHYNSFNRSISEPELPQIPYRFNRTHNNRGRPPTRLNNRRQETARGRRERLENEETVQGLYRYELRRKCQNISDQIQYIRHKLLGMGLTPQQLDDWQRLSQN